MKGKEKHQWETVFSEHSDMLTEECLYGPESSVDDIDEEVDDLGNITNDDSYDCENMRPGDWKEESACCDSDQDSGAFSSSPTPEPLSPPSTLLLSPRLVLAAASTSLHTLAREHNTARMNTWTSEHNRARMNTCTSEHTMAIMNTCTSEDNMARMNTCTSEHNIARVNTCTSEHCLKSSEHVIARVNSHLLLSCLHEASKPSVFTAYPSGDKGQQEMQEYEDRVAGTSAGLSMSGQSKDFPAKVTVNGHHV